MRFLIGLGILLIMGGCATLSEDQCKAGNWNAIGRNDGVSGMGTSRLASHQKACSEYGININTSEYNVGYNEGLTVFCTTENGFEQGKSGKNNARVCPGNLQVNFDKGYYEGKKIYDLETAIKAAETEIDRLNQEIENTYTAEQTEGKSYANQRVTLNRKKSTQEQKLRRLERELNLVMTTNVIKKLL